jgi:hypothetical protein
MTNTLNRNSEIQLLEKKEDKYLVKIENIDVPILIDEYLYNKWANQANNIDASIN